MTREQVVSTQSQELRQLLEAVIHPRRLHKSANADLVKSVGSYLRSDPVLAVDALLNSPYDEVAREAARVISRHPCCYQKDRFDLAEVLDTALIAGLSHRDSITRSICARALVLRPSPVKNEKVGSYLLTRFCCDLYADGEKHQIGSAERIVGSAFNLEHRWDRAFLCSFLSKSYPSQTRALAWYVLAQSKNAEYDAILTPLLEDVISFLQFPGAIPDRFAVEVLSIIDEPSCTLTQHWDIINSFGQDNRLHLVHEQACELLCRAGRFQIPSSLGPYLIDHADRFAFDAAVRFLEGRKIWAGMKWIVMNETDPKIVVSVVRRFLAGSKDLSTRTEEALVKSLRLYAHAVETKLEIAKLLGSYHPVAVRTVAGFEDSTLLRFLDADAEGVVPFIERFSVKRFRRFFSALLLRSVGFQSSCRRTDGRIEPFFNFIRRAE